MKKMIKRGLLAIATLALAAATPSVAFPTTAFAKEESGSSYITVEKYGRILIIRTERGLIR